MNVLIGVILGVATMWFAAASMSLVNGGQLLEENGTDEFGNVRWKIHGPNRAIGDDWPLAVAGGVVVAATYFLSRAVVFTPVSGLAILFMVFAMGWMAIVTVHGVWVAKKVSHVLCIAGTVAMFFVAAESAALAVVDSFRVRLVGAIPIVAMIVAIVALVGCYCYNRITHQSEALWKKKLTLGSGATVGFVGALLAVLVLAGAVGCSSQQNPAETSPEETSPTASTEASQGTTVSAEDLESAQSDLTVSVEEINKILPEKFKDFSDEPSDNSLAVSDKARVAAAGFSDALTFPLSGNTDEEKLSDVEREIFTNSVYGVTVARALVGKKIGNQTLGDLNPWMKAMIESDDAHGVAYWREYRDASRTSMRMTDEYRQNAAGICALLERMHNRGIQTRTTIENWCLSATSLNNDRKGELASYQYTKDALVLAYTAKSGAVLLEVGFNVHDKRPEFFGEEPSDGSSTPDNPDNPGPGPGPGPNPPTPEPKKDPSQLTPVNTEPNDNRGPGENTIDPKDPNHSTKDRDDNTTSYDNTSEYSEEIGSKAEVNENQRLGGDSNQPTTETPSGDTVENNGEAGTGNGGADTDTSTTDSAEPSDGSAVTKTGGDGAWGGGTQPE